MYLYIELWKAKDAWIALSREERQKYVDELLSAARNAPITGVIPVSVREVGDAVLLDGTTETPAIIDDRVARPPGYRYVSAYLIPSLELIDRFEKRVDSLGWWFDFFDQVNAWGAMDPRSVLGDMLDAGIPAPIHGRAAGAPAAPARAEPAPAARALRGSTAGETLAGTTVARGPMRWCPPGRLAMGPAKVETTLTRGFWIGETPVTQDQYRAVTHANPSSFLGGDSPVESLGKAEALAFCGELTRAERAAGRLPAGWRYDLPTEAQWEYACRAGGDGAWFWGDDPGRAGEYAWYAANSGGRTQPVGRKKPNAWGLHDVLGNVLEHCRDVFAETLPGGVDPEVTPADLPPRPGESDEPFYVARGGGWFYDVDGLRIDFRNRLGSRDQSYLIGFRVALVEDAPPGGSPARQAAGAAAGAPPGGPAPGGLPDLNQGPRSFEEVQRLVDRAAWLHFYAGPGPAGGDLPVRRFDVELRAPSASGARASNRLGEEIGGLRLSLVPIPDDFIARPGGSVPGVAWRTDRSQRVALAEAELRFGGADGFTSFGTGRTFPGRAAVPGGVAVAAIGAISRGTGRFSGLQGIYVLSGSVTPCGGFAGDIMVRVIDPRGVLAAQGALAPVAGRTGPGDGATYFLIRSRKSGPAQPTTYDLAPDGRVRGLDVPQTLYLARAWTAIEGAAGLRARLDVGAAIGEEMAIVAVDPTRPPSRPPTSAAPAPFQGVGEYVFQDAGGQRVGGFTAQFLEGRTVGMELEGAPGQPASRFGFFGPILDGHGCFEGAEGLLLGSTGVGIAPHVLSNLYVLRLDDPDGRWRDG